MRALTIVILALPLALSPAHAASLLKCGSGPLDIHDCPAGPAGTAGADGKDGVGTPGAKGDTGSAGKNGADFNEDDAVALSAALSPPVWLGDKENVRVSGGVGFDDSAAAVGASGIVRIDGALAGFVGGAVSTDTGEKAGKAGMSYDW